MTPVRSDHSLRRARRRRGLTLAVLADRPGLLVPFLSMVETGQRSLSRRDHINALATALRVQPTEIAPSALPGADEWAPVPAMSASPFPALCDEIVLARHRDLATEFTGYVIRGDTCAAGAWLRRLARDPSVSPWLLPDQIATRQADLATGLGPTTDDSPLRISLASHLDAVTTELNRRGHSTQTGG